jgi:hypothetical protein
MHSPLPTSPVVSWGNRPEVADIFHRYLDQYCSNNRLSAEQNKVVRHIRYCRTEALGGHVERCDACGFEKKGFNSCRNRHCPKCQTMVKEKWLADRKAELLPCNYFHAVFTISHDLNPLVLYNRQRLFNILFAALNETIKTFCRDPQWRLVGQPGFIAILHTWNQLLLDHFHLHCIIPAGVLTRDNRWLPARGDYLFRVQSMAKRFKKVFLVMLKKAHGKQPLVLPDTLAHLTDAHKFTVFINRLMNKNWRAYVKKPFAGPESVLEYLGRYTHRVAISNNRIKKIDNGEVTFTYRDRSDHNRIKEKTLGAAEFIRRFLLHVLPRGFVKIRYYGFLSHTRKKTLIPLIRRLIDAGASVPEKARESAREMMLRLTGIDILACPQCGKGKMIVISTIPPTGAGSGFDTS